MAEQKPGTDFMELFQRMINPMAFPLQQMLTAGLNPEELDKKIGELTTVRHWLNSNVSMLDLTIKTMEYQRALLTQGSKGGAKNKPSSRVTPMSRATSQTSTSDTFPENPLLNPALWPWSFMGLDKILDPAATPKPDSAATGATKKPDSKKS